jgi:hypothetical protein
VLDILGWKAGEGEVHRDYQDPAFPAVRNLDRADVVFLGELVHEPSKGRFKAKAQR